MPYDEHRDATRSTLRRCAVVEVDDSGDFQRLKLTGLAGEEFKNVVRTHDFGYASNPPPGSEGVLLPQGGRSDRAWALGFENKKYRQSNLPSGGSALYDMAGNFVKFLVNGVSHLTQSGDTSHATPNGKIDISAKKSSSVSVSDGDLTHIASGKVHVNPNGAVNVGHTKMIDLDVGPVKAGPITSGPIICDSLVSKGGISTGALEVAPDADGGLVQATMGLAVTGGETVDSSTIQSAAITAASIKNLSFSQLSALGPYANDTLAAAAGIPVGGAYLTTVGVITSASLTSTTDPSGGWPVYTLNTTAVALAVLVVRMA